MDKFEIRRAALRKLVDSFGRGGVAHVASKISRTDSYVSRMLYPQGKAGGKNIGEDLADALEREFPGWLGCNSRADFVSLPAKRVVTARAVFGDLLHLMKDADDLTRGQLHFLVKGLLDNPNRIDELAFKFEATLEMHRKFASGAVPQQVVKEDAHAQRERDKVNA